MTPDSTNYETIQYLTSQKPDIACLQEITFKNEEEIKRIDRIFSHAGYKLSCDFVGGNRIGIITKWPVIKSQVITHSKGNGAIAFYLEWPRRGDTLIVITAHLESMHLSQKERDKYHTLVKRPEEADTLHGKLDLKPIRSPPLSTNTATHLLSSWATSTTLQSPTLITEYVHALQTAIAPQPTA